MILWIDPWIRKIWYALIHSNLLIEDAWILLLDQKSPSRLDQFNRMEQIYDFFVELTETYQIDAVWIEKLYFTQYNQSNAEFVYGIRWALAMYFQKQAYELYEWTPKEIKKRITWNWAASKLQMQQSIQKLFSLDHLPDPHDAADALWLCRMIHNKKKFV